MKTILFLAHSDGGQEARMQAALDVTRAVHGHLTCLDMPEPPLPVLDHFGVPDQLLIEKEQGTQNRTRITDRLAHEDVAWTWAETADDPAAAIARSAEMADLIVASCKVSGTFQFDQRCLAGSIALRARRPVLAVPDGAQGIHLSERVVIAWDGSSAANAALRAAVPLLPLAADVILFEAGVADVAITAEEAAAYLSQHGIHARIIRAPRGTNIADTISEQARNARAGYVVMGAYGHSHMLEELLGGVTRSMLARSEIPLLLAH